MSKYCFFENLVATAHRYNININSMVDYTVAEMDVFWKELTNSSASAGIRLTDKKELAQFANHIRTIVDPEFWDAHPYTPEI